MEKHQINFNTATVHQHGWIFQYPETSSNSGNRLVLLHGAGVAGEVTWTYVCNYLDRWQEILVVDLAGMGGAEFLTKNDVEAANFSLQLVELLEALDWQQFDIAGYSFGGLIALDYLSNFHNSFSGEGFEGLLFLIEPAMLFSSKIADLKNKAAEYASIARDIEKGEADVSVYRRFLNSVSPNRKPNAMADELTMQRLRENASGFAAALTVVEKNLTARGKEFVAWQSPYSGVSFVGGLSPEPMKQRHQLLAEQSLDWQFIEVPNSDHSLVFTKPRTIAKAMNAKKAEQR